MSTKYSTVPQDHHGLADVQQLGGAVADDVDPQDLAGLAVKNQLEASGGIAADLAAGDLAIIRHADFIGNVFVGELLLGLADEGDFGNGVDPVRIGAPDSISPAVEGARGGDPALFHRDRREARETDDVADGENVRLLGAVIGVHFDAPAVVGFQAGGGEIQSSTLPCRPTA